LASGKRPLIVIGAPVYGTVSPEVLEDWMRFAYHLGRRMPEVDIATAIRTKNEQFRARNAIVEAALQANADYLLMLDDDMVLNPWVTQGPTPEYDLLRRLLAHDKDICGALYYQREGACRPVLMRAIGGGDTGYRFLRDDEITGGLQEVDVVGGGCMLIKMAVFHKVVPPYFRPEFEYGTDIQLCRAAKAKGFTVWADTGLELGHLRDERTILTSRNRHRYVLDDGLPGEVRKQLVQTDVYNRLADDVRAYTGLSVDELLHQVSVQTFLEGRRASGLSDPDWYRTFPRERVARQVWFNTQNANKKQMTEFILGMVAHGRPLDILDFGCGIGIPAFTFADKGHRVTACDVAGTGTLEFLKWRAQRANLPLTVHESAGGVPHLGDAQFDVIVAMDVLEHIAEWRTVLRELARHLKPTGVFFCNNGILNDTTHPEHYPLGNREFLQACLEESLMPVNQIMFLKPDPEAPTGAGATPKEMVTV
jgi:SAM-dependent methyltransferase